MSKLSSILKFMEWFCIGPKYVSEKVLQNKNIFSQDKYFTHNYWFYTVFKHW